MRDIRVLPSNAQDQVGDDLRIGAGNFWDREITDDQGTTKTVFSAMLWFFVRRPDLPEGQEEHRVVVWKGKEFVLHGFRFRILAVDKNPNSVTYEVSEIP